MKYLVAWKWVLSFLIYPKIIVSVLAWYKDLLKSSWPNQDDNFYNLFKKVTIIMAEPVLQFFPYNVRTSTSDCLKLFPNYNNDVFYFILFFFKAKETWEIIKYVQLSDSMYKGCSKSFQTFFCMGTFVNNTHMKL